MTRFLSHSKVLTEIKKKKKKWGKVLLILILVCADVKLNLFAYIFFELFNLLLLDFKVYDIHAL